MWVCGGVRDRVGPDVCDEGDARVVLEILEDGCFVGKACLIAAEDNAQGSGRWCDSFDDHDCGYYGVGEVVCSSLGEGGVVDTW